MILSILIIIGSLNYVNASPAFSAAIMHGSIINNTASLHTDDILISGAGDDFNTAEISKSSILFSLITSQNERQYIEVYSIDGNINLCNYMISVYNGKFSFSESGSSRCKIQLCVIWKSQ